MNDPIYRCHICQKPETEYMLTACFSCNKLCCPDCCSEINGFYEDDDAEGVICYLCDGTIEPFTR